MVKRRFVALLIGLFIFSYQAQKVFALEKYSAYKNNIDISKVEKNKIRLQQIDKETNNVFSTTSKYKYNQNSKATFRDYKKGSISYEYDVKARVVKGVNKFKNDINTTRLPIKHKNENSSSEYIHNDQNKIKRKF